MDRRLVLALLILVLISAGYSWLKPKDDLVDVEERTEQEVYNANLTSLREFEKKALRVKYGFKLGLDEDWDKDGLLNKVEARGYPHLIFDPTNSFEEGLNEEELSYVESIVGYIEEIYPSRTLMEFIDKESLSTAIGFGVGIYENFTARERYLLPLLVEYVDGIEDQGTTVIQAAVIQIDDVIYDEGLHEVEDEEYVWENFIGSAIYHIIELVEEDEIRLGNLTIEEVKQILLPQKLYMINIRSGERTGPWLEAKLECGVENVTPIKELDWQSPQEWIRLLVKTSFESRDELYDEAIWRSKSGPYQSWPNSAIDYRKKRDFLLDTEPLVIALIGYPAALRPQIEELSEQGSASYSVILGRGFGIPVYDIIAPYPGNLENGIWSHDDPLIRISNGEYVGFWSNKTAFLLDYEGSEIEPYITQFNMGKGRWVPFKLD